MANTASANTGTAGRREIYIARIFANISMLAVTFTNRKHGVQSTRGTHTDTQSALLTPTQYLS